MSPRRVVGAVTLPLLGFVFLSWAIAQQTGGGSSGSGGGSAGGNASKTNPTPVQPRSSTTNTLPEPPKLQMLFVSGAVVMEDGSPVPMGTAIERVCGGRSTLEAYVSANGNFAFSLGGANRISGSMFADASQDLNDLSATRTGRVPVPTTLMGCELRAQLAGYRSSRLVLDGSHTMGNVNAGTILLVPLARVKGSLVSASDLGAPKSARKALERAQKAFREDNLADAEKNLKTAVGEYQGYAAAWVGLGQVYQKLRRLPEARNAYEQAIAADDKFVSPYVSLAQLAGIEQKWQEMADWSDRALELDPVDSPEAYFFNAVANYNLTKLEAAERSALKTQRLDPQGRLPYASIILANVLEQRNDVAGAIQQLQNYLASAPQSSNAAQVRTRLEQLELSLK